MRAKLDAVSVAAVLVAVVTFSVIGPLTPYAAGPPFARNALGLLTLGPAFMLIPRREVRKFFRKERFLVRTEQRARSSSAVSPLRRRPSASPCSCPARA
ncbi:hypothetical protein QQY66_01525 [Streptomyces sp. DG2A-72]|uniref:hypothetical protein n=1 Tax=Streptomyces sp. DG2A-72 TaxID=3051386 RepID=UPI00265BAE98|nr:hypothetical protein [Streptomyces sp. DG2A-72]MDO0930442.1 hypothetical protein [Streptomyces sp. DG2A-72]